MISDILPEIDLMLKVFFNIFKDIAPTLVALLAIWINNKSARKRDENNKKIDIKLKMLWELWEIVNEVFYSVSKLGAYAYTANESNGSGDNTEFFDLDSKIIILQRTMKDIAKRYEVVFNKNVNWSEFYESIEIVRKKSSSYVLDIFNYNNKKLIKEIETALDKFDTAHEKLLDEIHKNIKELSS